MMNKLLFACASALLATTAYAADPVTDPYDDYMSPFAEDQCQRDGICSPSTPPPRPSKPIIQ